MAQVKIDKVSKKFGKFKAVKEFSLDIQDGEFIVLVGPSGCGKTTLLRMVAGLEKVTSGEIFIDQTDVTRTPPKKRDIAMVFQNYALYPHMNVYNNLAFALKLRKIPKAQIKATVEKTADLLGIGDFLNRRPNQLSGGQKQRVALGRAIVRQPKVFLFDEPLSNLDAKLRVSMRAEILDIHRRLNNTSLYVTHDQLEAMTMGTRIIIMKDGVIQQNGPPKEIYNNPANKFVAGFIGSPAMNLMRFVIQEDAGKLMAVKNGLALMIPEEKNEPLKSYLNQAVFLGLRPEHISDSVVNGSEAANAAFKAFVRLVEPLGSEQLIHLEAEDQRFIARIDPRSSISYGDTLEFHADMNFAAFFDADTETRIV
ncbi:MAG: sn-glycerol-3-phosphate ABC transporter ATP-binding protein UgpC [Deltaproteobacteria bacterium]|nr:sn-glycerol-3-phosphate ABC transporter ATP-binding protein UgpC [Deltaproteobacteria bacterium]